MKKTRKLISAFLCFLFPTGSVFWILNLLGHKIHHRSRIGFSWVWTDGVMALEESAKIGHFNIIRINSVVIGKSGYIGKFNNINGPIELILDETAAIGN